MTFKLPDLPYAHDALAPYMSKETLEYHHDKHHKAYVDNGNKLLEGSGLEGKSLEEIVKASFGKNAGLFNNAGQHYNHMHFWKWMKPNGGGDKIPAKLKAKIDSDLGGVEKMKADFATAGATQFGSGWCWIAVQAASSPSPRRRTAKIRWCTAARQFWAAMCGTLLLHRLSQPPARLSESLPRSHGELGLRRRAARRRPSSIADARSRGRHTIWPTGLPF